MNEFNRAKFMSDCIAYIGSGDDRIELHGSLTVNGRSVGKSQPMSDIPVQYPSEVMKAVASVSRARAWPVEYLADFK
jgi:hypothetical protein